MQEKQYLTVYLTWGHTVPFIFTQVHWLDVWIEGSARAML